MGYFARSNWDGSVPYRKSRAKPAAAPVRVLSDAELVDMGRRLRQRDEATAKREARFSFEQAQAKCGARAAFEGEKAMSKTISIGGKGYTWAELSNPEVRRAILPQVEAMIAQFNKHPELMQAQGYTALDLKTAI